jgi:hypothetical protein
MVFSIRQKVFPERHGEIGISDYRLIYDGTSTVRCRFITVEETVIQDCIYQGIRLHA